jgi:hypothetical protein
MKQFTRTIIVAERDGSSPVRVSIISSSRTLVKLYIKDLRSRGYKVKEVHHGVAHC